jgi:type II secretory pathway pseudopilin PulG
MTPLPSTGRNPLSMLLRLAAVVAVLVVLAGWGIPAYARYQARQDAANQIQLNALRIQQTQQLVQVESQKAQIKVTEARGIAEAQQIINATLTDKYLQHEAIQAQEKMADSPNHTTIYIPSGQNGIPLVRTVNDEPEHTASPH